MRDFRCDSCVTVCKKRVPGKKGFCMMHRYKNEKEICSYFEPSCSKEKCKEECSYWDGESSCPQESMVK